ncbi:hypothetical protein evm_006750 [Chilo suppressalis]|nr:hypothetical protein evm_006750 [Chilo suppressalis]
MHADQAADGTRTRTLCYPGERTDQLCYRGPDGRVEIFLALSCKAAPSLRIVVAEHSLVTWNATLQIQCRSRNEGSISINRELRS